MTNSSSGAVLRSLQKSVCSLSRTLLRAVDVRRRRSILCVDSAAHRSRSLSSSIAAQARPPSIFLGAILWNSVFRLIPKRSFQQRSRQNRSKNRAVEESRFSDLDRRKSRRSLDLLGLAKNLLSDRYRDKSVTTAIIDVENIIPLRQQSGDILDSRNRLAIDFKNDCTDRQLVGIRRIRSNSRDHQSIHIFRQLQFFAKLRSEIGNGHTFQYSLVAIRHRDTVATETRQRYL